MNANIRGFRSNFLLSTPYFMLFPEKPIKQAPRLKFLCVHWRSLAVLFWLFECPLATHRIWVIFIFRGFSRGLAIEYIDRKDARSGIFAFLDGCPRRTPDSTSAASSETGFSGQNLERYRKKVDTSMGSSYVPDYWSDPDGRGLGLHGAWKS